MRKMQRRFILAAMISFATVMLILAVGINVANYHQVRVRQDDMLNGICEYERMKASHPERRRPPISDMPWARGPEAEFTIRFFAVHCDMSGKIVLVTRDHISSVDENTAREYTEKILSKGRERGYHEDYRYLVKPDQDGISVVFLNIFEDIQAGRSLLAATVIIGIASLLAVFALVVVFSGRAIRPYIRNIERQKRFITDAGHELKTPLTSIATSADIAAMEHGDDEWIANIRKQSARLAKLVGELMTLSRLDEEEPLPEKALFSLSDAAWEIAEPFSAGKLEKHFFLSYKHMAAVFKKEKQLTLQQYHNKVRMTEACRLLKSTLLPVGEISKELGYPDMLYFSRCFHRFAGMSPTQYRKSVPSFY